MFSVASNFPCDEINTVNLLIERLSTAADKTLCEFDRTLSGVEVVWCVETTKQTQQQRRRNQHLIDV